MTIDRRIESIHAAFRTVEGDGIDVLRAVPGQGYESVGPFIFLDHFGPIAWQDGEAKGASSHPHAGIETMTLLLEGRMRHKDSLGNESTMAPGDVQWMRAGRGIVHDEQPDVSAMSPGERTHGIQVWLNLPSGGKHVAPQYRHVTRPEIPLIASTHDANRIRLVAGDILDARGPVETGGRPLVVHASLAMAEAMSIPVRPEAELAVYVMLGAARVGVRRDRVAAGQLARLAPGEQLLLANEPDTELLVFGGDPLDARIVRYGPFVMNTLDELRRAVADFQAGRMGHIAA